MSFELKEVVWAKIDKYPWWPALIVKLPKSPTQDYRINFFGQKHYAFVPEKCLQNYAQKYDQHTNARGKNQVPQKCIQQADKYVKQHKQGMRKAQSSNEIQSCRRGKTNKLKHQISQMHQDISEKKPQSQICNDIKSGNGCEILEIDFKKLSRIEGQWKQILSTYLEKKKQGQSKTDIIIMIKNFDFSTINDQQLSKTKITNIIKYLQNLANQQNEIQNAAFFSQLFTRLKTRILNYLTSTDYYQQFLNVKYEQQQEQQISEPESATNFEDKVFDLLKKNYHFKKNNARIVSDRLSQYLDDWINQKKTQIIKQLKSKTFELKPGRRQHISQDQIENYILKIVNDQ